MLWRSTWYSCHKMLLLLWLILKNKANLFKSDFEFSRQKCPFEEMKLILILCGSSTLISSFSGFTTSGKGSRKFFINTTQEIRERRKSGFPGHFQRDFLLLHSKALLFWLRFLPLLSFQFLHLNPWAVLLIPKCIVTHCVNPIRKHFNHPLGNWISRENGLNFGWGNFRQNGLSTEPK